MGTRSPVNDYTTGMPAWVVPPGTDRAHMPVGICGRDASDSLSESRSAVLHVRFQFGSMLPTWEQGVPAFAHKSEKA
jgi:hypothetical protein